MIADDHTLIRETLRDSLDAESDFVVCATASDGHDLPAKVLSARPDVLLMDVHMPRHDPVDVVPRLLGSLDGLQILVLSADEDRALTDRMLDLGVAGYLSKSINRDQLVGTIRAASGARADGLVVRTVFTRPRAAAPPAGAEGSPSLDQLSEREVEVLRLVARALSNRQVATRLSITEGTVKRHLRNIFDKLGVASRMEAVTHLPAAQRAGREPMSPK